jgi:predicted amino acid racemase
MAHPYITIDLDKIEHNARTIVRLCAEHGIDVIGVTKGVCGNPEVAQAMLKGGVSGIADSRLENIRRLGTAGIDAPYMMLRLPPLSTVDEVVQLTKVSLNSELQVLVGLSLAAQRRGLIHDVIVMVDLGDLREGVWADDLIRFMGEALGLPGIRVIGLGTNLACFAGVIPSVDNMNQMVELAVEVEQTFNTTIGLISGINSSGLDVIRRGEMPQRINQARIGEAILLGRETTHRRPWPNTYQNAFALHAEIIEVKTKPSLPLGQLGEDAFGRLPGFEDRGMRRRALLNIGREDVDIDGITPQSAGLEIIGASSGYVVIDVDDAKQPVQVGDELSFSLNYAALLAAMTSEYVQKRPRRRELAAEAQR